MPQDRTSSKDKRTGRFTSSMGKAAARVFGHQELSRLITEAITPEDVARVVRQYYLVATGSDELAEIRVLKACLADEDPRVRLDAAAKLMLIRRQASDTLLNRVFGYPRESSYSSSEEVKHLSVSVEDVRSLSGSQLNRVIEQIDVKEKLAQNVQEAKAARDDDQVDVT